ncbi:hypothetical protein ETB97_012163 [Aspergillus alliaceus]|uniref:Polyketide synthase n=1 Tax=Petromyces alliaceus TaxID=209559 RepID=A0A8H6E857_PETAA|nr:hypothetical protein ETB97_012163 [Aspergillus burnettii]
MVDKSNEGSDSLIAIVGMAVRLPGEVNTTDEFWKFLSAKKHGLGEVPGTRYNVDAFLNPCHQGLKTKNGHFLAEDPGSFDADFFSISDHDAALMDPQQRKLMEITWECLESAGETNWRGKDIGFYVGAFSEDWLDITSKDTQSIDRSHTICTGSFALSNRVSYEYDFRGPSMTIMTGCSASLIALHEACQDVRSGQCSSAIIAGVNIIGSPTMTIAMTLGRVLSASGSCKTFDERADGYGRGEAVNAVYIKRLDDALRNGDPIRAVIRGTGTNSDGRTQTISTPGVASQKQLIQRTYQSAGLTLSETGFFECHGTGTLSGDIAETTVVADLCGGKGMVIGSVKGNVGHSEGASGLTSVIKAVLALENRVIPPNVFFERPNPSIPFKEGGLHVPTEPMPWPVGRKEIASINSFGIGGSNCHAILQSAASYLENPRASLTLNNSSVDGDALRLLVVSAKSQESLQTRIAEATDFVNNNPDILHDTAYTLGTRREHLRYRAFVVAHSHQQIERSEWRTCRAEATDIVFVFTGQGAQWPGMGKSMLDNFAAFKASIQIMDKALQELPHPPSWSLEAELAKTGNASRVGMAEFSQPLCTALQVGLVSTLANWGISPSAVVGHSSGEIAAAFASGAMDMKSAIIIAYYRGLAAKCLEGAGAMAAVGLSMEEVSRYVNEKVVIACENGPHNVTLSGEREDIHSVVEQIRAEWPEALCQPLRVTVAYHSYQMAHIGALYEQQIAPYIDLDHRANMIPFISSVSCRAVTNPRELDAGYWRRNLESPVLFAGAVRSILEKDTAQVFVEIGPHSALAGVLRQSSLAVSPGKNVLYFPTLTRNDTDSRNQLLWTVGCAHANGISVDLSRVNGIGKTLSNLPRYPWQHKYHWKESRVANEWRTSPVAHHEILGSRDTGSSAIEPSWRNMLLLGDVPWLWDHDLQGQVVFPAAGYIAMVGEAVQQLNPSSSGYNVRNVQLKAALVLKDDRYAEIITTMRRVMYNDMIDSDWYAFTIVSHDGTGWTKHCHGEVKAAYNHLQWKPIEAQLRPVDAEKWYAALSRSGLNYGPRFRGLEDISVHPSEYRATGTVADNRELHGSRYNIHPVAIDQCLQLMSVASSNGLARRIDRMAIPLSIKRIAVRTGSGMMRAEATIVAGGTITDQSASASLMTDDSQALSLEGAVFFHTVGEGNNDSSFPLVSEIRWNEDIDLVSVSKILAQSDNFQSHEEAIRDAEKVCALAILETADRMKGVQPGSQHLIEWKNWISNQSCALREGKNALVPEGEQYAQMCSEERHQMMEVAISKCQTHGGISAAFGYLKKILENCADITIDESRVPTVMEMFSNISVDTIDAPPKTNWGQFLGLLGHSKPTMRILEIGAEGAATREALKHLRTPEGVMMFSEYVLTDVSSDMIDAASKRFEDQENFKYRLLDISRDPRSQGYKPHSFDLIIASNAVHNSPRLHESLQHIRQLLAHTGDLMSKYLMGVLPDWWNRQANKHDTCCVSPEQLERELSAAGFTGNEAFGYEDPGLFPWSFTMLSRPTADRSSPLSRSAEVFILSSGGHDVFSQEVASCFHESGIHVTWGSLADNPGPNHFIISLLDLEGPFLYDMSEEVYQALQMFTRTTRKNHMLWVTPTCQTNCPDPRYGLVFGFLRALRQETGLDVSFLEMDCFDLNTARSVFTVYEKIAQSRREKQPYPEYEFLLTEGKIRVGRCYWVPPEKRPHEIIEEAHRPTVLSIGTPGLMDTLQWVPGSSYAHVGENEVEVDMRYVGLNFRDVMISMGFFGNQDQFGFEGSGIVRSVGSNVKNYQPGERVSLMGAGSFRTRVVTHERNLLKVPPGQSLEDAAALLVVYSTAIYSLSYIGKLKAGQTVLIHSACGGVGLASIQICKALGATVYATVGDDNKVQMLMKQFSIPRHHIFDSRSTSFLPDLMRETNGRGVDIVLNSLADELLHASWECVAPYGTMVELGKRDLATNGAISLTPFLRNRTYVGVDMAAVNLECPDKQAEEGNIRPIRPVKVFEAIDIVSAFRYMQRGVHTGKIVIKLPEDPKTLAKNASQPGPVTFSSNASYLLVGGLGGIGKAIATWMVERGARNLVFLGRSAGISGTDQSYIRELEAQGCNAQCVAGSVTIAADVEHAISLCGSRPLAGVLQMAMSLNDQLFDAMNYDEWSACLAPKVQGTWNLHNAVRDRNLDFFVAFSSISGTCGNVGQSNYAAANTFLDCFTQYRRYLGLPSSVLNLGAVEDIGVISKDTKLLQTARAVFQRLLREREVLEALELCIRQSAVRTSPAPWLISSPCIVGLNTTNHSTNQAVNAPWKGEGRFGLYSNLEKGGKVGGLIDARDEAYSIVQKLQKRITTLDDEEAEMLLLKSLNSLITQYIAGAKEMSYEDKGNIVIDSLMAAEVGNWARRNMRIDLSILEISKAGTVKGVCGLLIERMRRLATGSRNDTSAASS